MRNWPAWPLPIFLLSIVWYFGAARYIGHGSDDYYYLAAVRCVADQFWCVPPEHWARRAPVILPAAAFVRLLGLNQFALWLAPALYAVVSIIVFTRLIGRLFGPATAMVSGSILVLTPAFSQLTPALGIDIAEFAFLMLAAYGIERNWATGRSNWAALVGLAIGFAVMCRPTTLAIVPIFAFAFWKLKLDARATLKAVVALLAILLIEAGIYQFLAGNALLTWQLSLHHTKIPSTQLHGVNLNRSPLFNIDFIRAWKPAAGIDAHWTVRGLINFAASPGLFLTFYWSVILGIIAAAKRTLPSGHMRLLGWLIVASLVYFAELTFIFAIDPQPRMFLAIVALLCLICGAGIATLPAGAFTTLGIVALSTIAFRGLTEPFSHPNFETINQKAVEIEKDFDNRLPIYSMTARGLALDNRVTAWPIFDQRSREVLVVGEGGCRRVKNWIGQPNWETSREILATRPVPRIIGWLREKHLFVTNTYDPTLCVFSARTSSTSHP